MTFEKMKVSNPKSLAKQYSHAINKKPVRKNKVIDFNICHLRKI